MVPTLAECASSRLPRVEAAYELPDMFVVIYDYVDGVTLDHYAVSYTHLTLPTNSRV